MLFDGSIGPFITSEFMTMKKYIYALGFFDGVHLGHQALLSQCRHLASELGCQTAAITFDRHPQALFTPTPPLLISSTEDRLLLLKKYGMAQVNILPVSNDVMSTYWEDFLRKLTEKGAVGFVCGDDFRFGAKGEGNCEKLRSFCAQHSLPCIILPEQDLDGRRISSTRIRQALENGDLNEANRLLGHPYTLTGTVVTGQALGRTIGVPTANVHLPEGILCPAFGVYACKATVAGTTYPAVTNIGTRPTVGGRGVTIEPWLLDFEGDLYGKQLTLEFFAYLRPEKKFPDLQALQQEILKNAAETRKIFEKT